MYLDGSEEQISKAKAAMTPVATPYFEAHKNDDDAVRFLYTKGDDLAERLADLIKVKPPFPCLIMLDMSSRKKWVFKGDELDSNTVTNCFERWQKKEIEAVMF